MTYKIGGYAKTTGKTKAFRRLPANAGDIAPANMIPVTTDKLLLLVDKRERSEPSEFNPREKNVFVMWKVVVGEVMVWISEEVLRLPRRDEVPEEAWHICGI